MAVENGSACHAGDVGEVGVEITQRVAQVVILQAAEKRGEGVDAERHRGCWGCGVRCVGDETVWESAEGVGRARRRGRGELIHTGDVGRYLVVVVGKDGSVERECMGAFFC